jgi:hypothetical protein
MKILMILVISIFILVLIGHGERCEANDINTFVKTCRLKLDGPKPFCECVAEKADERLTRKGFAFQIAYMNKDEAMMKKLLDQMGIMEKGDAGMFMVNIFQECDLPPEN